MDIDWRKAVKRLLILWGVSSVLSLGMPHVLDGGWKAIPFALMFGASFTLVIGLPAVLVLFIVDAARQRRQRVSD